MWPFSRRRRSEADDHAAQFNRRIDDLQAQVAVAEVLAEYNAPRVRSARTHAEIAANQRAEAIRQNHFDLLFLRDLRGDQLP